MGLIVESEHMDGLVVFRPEVFRDDRGYFMESFNAGDFAKAGLPVEFPQDNHSFSVKNVIRGLHFQWYAPQGKLLRVTAGAAFVAEVDIRPGSPTFGKFFTIELSARNMLMLWIPPGFANGFCSLEDGTEMQYKCSAAWNPGGESSIRWNDPALGIPWPIDDPVISRKDAEAQLLSDWKEKPESKFFMYSK